MDLMQLENEILIGGKGDNPKGSFKVWLLSKEGKAALKLGIKIEMEHTKDRRIAREIAIDHLKEDRKYYQKLAKVGLDEVYHSKAEFDRDATDDLIDPAETTFFDDEKIDYELALRAIKEPQKIKRYTSNPNLRNTLRKSLQQISATASHLLQKIVTAEAAMGVGSSSVGGNPGDKGSGVPVTQPAGQTRKMGFDNKKLRPSKAGKGMMAPDSFIGGKSAFSKGVL